jgi:hypothetical protein
MRNSGLNSSQEKKKKRPADVAASKTAVNYILFDQKIIFDFLKSHLWAAAKMSSKPKGRGDGGDGK